MPEIIKIYVRMKNDEKKFLMLQFEYNIKSESVNLNKNKWILLSKAVVQVHVFSFFLHINVSGSNFN
jgi:hypothetical protein